MVVSGILFFCLILSFYLYIRSNITFTKLLDGDNKNERNYWFKHISSGGQSPFILPFEIFSKNDNVAVEKSRRIRNYYFYLFLVSFLSFVTSLNGGGKLPSSNWIIIGLCLLVAVVLMLKIKNME